MFGVPVFILSRQGYSKEGEKKRRKPGFAPEKKREGVRGKNGPVPETILLILPEAFVAGKKTGLAQRRPRKKTRRVPRARSLFMGVREKKQAGKTTGFT